MCADIPIGDGGAEGVVAWALGALIATSSATLPGRGVITATRDDRNTASKIECVTKTTVQPSFSRSASSSFQPGNWGCLVERGEGLVHQQYIRPGDEGAGDRDAHLHAAGELARPPSRNRRGRPVEAPPHLLPRNASRYSRSLSGSQTLAKAVAMVSRWAPGTRSRSQASRPTRRMRPGFSTARRARRSAERGRFSAAGRGRSGSSCSRAGRHRGRSHRARGRRSGRFWRCR